jgi:hypothetical protein
MVKLFNIRREEKKCIQFLLYLLCKNASLRGYRKSTEADLQQIFKF